jgi:S-adenosylmethionine hydrolase
VVGVNAGHAFSFLRDAGIEVRQVVAAAAGSQFRSRDVFPEALARVLAGEDGAVGEVLDRDAIPPVPERRIAYIDGFGNMKTTVRAGGLAPGARVRISIAGVGREAVVAGGGFGVPEGELAFAAGSSGWPVGDGRVRWTEVFLRGGSAWEAFQRPPSGAELSVEAMPVGS